MESQNAVDAVTVTPTSGEPTLLTRVTGLWFEDGNIVLRAGDSIFKVYSGILSARSPVFRDLFSFSQPRDAEQIDGCHFILLHDSVEDTTSFLKAIYDSGFFEPPPAQVNLHIAAGILRLSDKYDVDYLKRRALRHLSQLSPMSINEFDKFSEAGLHTRWSKFCAFALINVARDTGALWLLPVALYSACNLGIETILYGMSCSGSRFTLRESDKKICLIARQELISVYATKISKSFIPSGKKCPTPFKCNSSKLHYLHMWSDCLGAHPLSYHSWFYQTKADMCPACNEAEGSIYLYQRLACWDSLPTLFGLPGWSNLARMRKLALEE